MGYNGRLSLKILEKSVKVQNLPYPLLNARFGTGTSLTRTMIYFSKQVYPQIKFTI